MIDVRLLQISNGTDLRLLYSLPRAQILQEYFWWRSKRCCNTQPVSNTNRRCLFIMWARWKKRPEVLSFTLDPMFKSLVHGRYSPSGCSTLYNQPCMSPAYIYRCVPTKDVFQRSSAQGVCLNMLTKITLKAVTEEWSGIGIGREVQADVFSRALLCSLLHIRQ